MGIEAKHIRSFIWRMLKISINICFRILQKYPFVSIILVLLFVLYYFFTEVFIFLIYSSPFLACIAVFIRFYLLSKCSKKIQSKVKDEKKDHAISSIKSEPRACDLVVNTTILRRNVKEKNKELEAEQAVMKEKNIICTKEEKPREIAEKNKTSSSKNGESVSRNASIGENNGAFTKGSKSDLISLNRVEEQAAKFDGGGGGEAELESSSSESEDEEEETKKTGNKAVEWTEDDQKNLMDLGISELERNKRLESLIARRRVRKLFKMRTEKILISAHNNIPIPVAPVLVSRSNPFDVPSNPDEQIPGSAPSVLLPARNPFDLPYDPFEEKPNLMADSFQQEFMTAHQKDLFFCRHESFNSGPSFTLDGRYNDNVIGGNSRFRRQQIDKGEHDWLVDHLLSQQGSQGGASTSHGGESTSQDGESKLQRSSSSLSVTDLVTEEGESSNQDINQPEEGDGEVEHSRIEMKGKKIENNNGKESSLEIGSETGTNAIKHDKNESSSSSLSSDNEQIIKVKKTEALSIEPPVFIFPEILISPSPNLDPYPIPSPNSNPCPIPKARTPTELSYAASPATIDRSRIENHLLYTNNVPWHTPTHSIASDMQVEVSEMGSPPLTEDGSASSNDGESLTYDGDIKKEITSGSEEMWGVSPHALVPKVNEVDKEETTRGLFDPIASTSRNEIAQESRYHKISSDHKIFNDAEQVGEQRPPNTLHEVPSENSIERTLTPYEGFLQKQQESLNPYEKSAEEVNMVYSMDDPVLVQVNDRETENLKANIDRDARIEKFIEQEVSVDLSKRSERSSSEDKNCKEVVVFGINQSFNDPSTSSIYPEMTVDQVSNISSSSSSLKSILPDQAPFDNINTDVPEFDMEEKIMRDKLLDEVRNKLLDDQILENLGPVSPKKEQQLTYQPSINSKSEKLKEISNKAEEMPIINKPVINDGEVEEYLKSMKIINDELEISTRNENTSSEVEEMPIINDPMLNDGEAKEDLKSVKTNIHCELETLIRNEKEQTLWQNYNEIKDSVDDNMTSKEKFELVACSEDESQRVDKNADTMDTSKDIEEPTSGTIRDTETESRNLTKEAVNTSQLQAAEENKSSNNISEASDGQTEAP